MVEALRRVLCRLLQCHKHEPEAAPIPEWTLRIGQTAITFQGAWKMNIRDDSPPLPLSVTWKDAKGKTAVVDPNTPTTYTSSDENLLKITTDADGKPQVEVGALDGVDADANGLIGDPVQIVATADADVGDGVKPVTAAGAAQVTSGEAAVGEVKIG